MKKSGKKDKVIECVDNLWGINVMFDLEQGCRQRQS